MELSSDCESDELTRKKRKKELRADLRRKTDRLRNSFRGKGQFGDYNMGANIIRQDYAASNDFSYE